ATRARLAAIRFSPRRPAIAGMWAAQRAAAPADSTAAAPDSPSGSSRASVSVSVLACTTLTPPCPNFAKKRARRRGRSAAQHAIENRPPPGVRAKRPLAASGASLAAAGGGAVAAVAESGDLVGVAEVLRMELEFAFVVDVPGWCDLAVLTHGALPQDHQAETT